MLSASFSRLPTPRSNETVRHDRQVYAYNTAWNGLGPEAKTAQAFCCPFCATVPPPGSSGKAARMQAIAVDGLARTMGRRGRRVEPFNAFCIDPPQQSVSAFPYAPPTRYPCPYSGMHVFYLTSILELRIPQELGGVRAMGSDCVAAAKQDLIAAHR